MTETLLAVAVGGVIGALGPVLIAVIQSRAESRRHSQRLAFESGLADFRARHEMLMQRVARGGKGSTYPPWVAIHYSLQLIERLDKKGRLTADDIREIRVMQKELLTVLEEPLP